jgi:ribosomal protein S12 methylthiotransferase RimO
VALVTLGCARNEVDSEELAGRLAAEGWLLVDDAAQADVAVINTCGFVQQAKKDSIDALLEASDLKGSGRTQKVVAVGCLAERYGEQLAAELPEADAVLGFDSYADMSSHLTSILGGHRPASHVPSDRRRLLPLSPTSRQATAASMALPGHGRHDGPPLLVSTAPEDGAHTDALLEAVAPASGPRVIRARLDGRPWAPLKIASGCDRRCAFCAIPMFRGSFVSRRPSDVLAEARWLGERDVRELFLVSENSTSYGKDLGDLRLLETMLPELAAVEGIERVRVSYLQPAEIRMDLLDVMASTPGVVPYFDISFQHASESLLRRMRRFGSPQSFLELIDQVRARAPLAGIRSNVIVGFPGETQADLVELEAFLTAARLDVVGVFGYSDEDGTEAEMLDGKFDRHVIAERVDHFTTLVEELNIQRAEERIGERVEVLVEGIDELTGRAAHQGPDVDGATILRLPRGARAPAVGSIIAAVVLETDGIDLIAEPG